MKNSNKSVKSLCKEFGYIPAFTSVTLFKNRGRNHYSALFAPNALQIAIRACALPVRALNIGWHDAVDEVSATVNGAEYFFNKRNLLYDEVKTAYEMARV